eukprot:CAMPEP_0185020184 /NCGR_PEP_ID=MMETSP1103-20130426/2784_1 /TAXON_ID=36769 /ORGANISM="Paraphysomonas bandaiensis, Strain Caron Lab Isolate" /LENGTH=49 /DNA_ID=CAMNT_0027550931 /DNA_START=227 /DNA_END=376 /DNA_ORIENTATION=+
MTTDKQRKSTTKKCDRIPTEGKKIMRLSEWTSEGEIEVIIEMFSEGIII